MIKYSIFKSLIILTMLVTVPTGLQAQKIDNTASADSSSIKDKYKKVVPGRLFDLSNILSTGAVSTVYGEALSKTPTANSYNTLFGQMAGLTVNQNSGEPGNDNPTLAIRGVGSYNTGSIWNKCKIFVDGFEVPSSYLSYFPTANIESISVLKDAISLAQFGMLGNDGIVWVVTKKGSGKPKISFQTSTGIQTPTILNKPLGSYDYANLYNQANSNDNGNVWTPKYSDTELQAYKDGTGTNVDWFNEVLKKQGHYTESNLSFSGGDKSVKYFVGLNYANQQGLLNVKNTDTTSNVQFKRYSVFSNLSFQMFKIFEVRTSLNARLEDRKSPNTSSNIFTDLSTYPSNIYPVYDGNTTNLSGTSVFPRNPYASITSTGWQSSTFRYLQASFGLKERLDFITSGLYLDESVSFQSYSAVNYNKTRNYARYYNGATTTNDLNTNIVASPMSAVGQDDRKMGKILLGYDRIFGTSHIQSAVDYSMFTENSDGRYYKFQYASINGKTNYSFKDKYIAEFGFSYFGIDYYKPGNQWGFYPSVGAAWVLSEEAFLQNNALVNYLKLRGSMGNSGNYESNVYGQGRYLYQQYYSGISSSFTTGNTSLATPSTLGPNYIANAEIFAEKSTKYNVGMDMTLFKKLSLTIDAFMDKRSGIITVDNYIPGAFGYNQYYDNIGLMTNKGIEADLSYSDKIGNLTYNVRGMVSFNKNTIDYMAEVPAAYDYNAYTGRPYGTPIGLVSEGFFQLNDFNADGTLKAGIPVPSFGKVQAGDLKYSDLNDDKKIDQNDVTAIGKSYLPELTFSIGTTVNYKGLDFSLFLQGSAGSSVNLLNSANSQVEAFTNNGNAFPIAKGAWAYYPEHGIDNTQTATYPRLTTVNNNNNYRTSSFWMKNTEFLRIRNVELGYTFDSSYLQRIKISGLRIYLNSTNPVTWSKLMSEYKIDPETFGGYPALKSFNIGLYVNY